MKIKVSLIIHIKHTRVRKSVVTQKQKMMPVLLVANLQKTKPRTLEATGFTKTEII